MKLITTGPFELASGCVPLALLVAGELPLGLVRDIRLLNCGLCLCFVSRLIQHPVRVLLVEFAPCRLGERRPLDELEDGLATVPTDCLQGVSVHLRIEAILETGLRHCLGNAGRDVEPPKGFHITNQPTLAAVLDLIGELRHVLVVRLLVVDVSLQHRRQLLELGAQDVAVFHDVEHVRLLDAENLEDLDPHGELDAGGLVRGADGAGLGDHGPVTGDRFVEHQTTRERVAVTEHHHHQPTVVRTLLAEAEAAVAHLDAGHRRPIVPTATDAVGRGVGVDDALREEHAVLILLVGELHVSSIDDVLDDGRDRRALGLRQRLLSRDLGHADRGRRADGRGDGSLGDGRDRGDGRCGSGLRDGTIGDLGHDGVDGGLATFGAVLADQRFADTAGQALQHQLDDETGRADDHDVRGHHLEGGGGGQGGFARLANGGGSGRDLGHLRLHEG